MPARGAHVCISASIEFEGFNLSMTLNANILTNPVGGGHSCLSLWAKLWRSFSWSSKRPLPEKFNRRDFGLRTRLANFPFSFLRKKLQDEPINRFDARNARFCKEKSALKILNESVYEYRFATSNLNLKGGCARSNSFNKRIPKLMSASPCVVKGVC